MKIAIYLAFVLIAGCATTTANIERVQLHRDAETGQFVPVKAFFNRSVPVPNYFVSRLEAAEAALKKSGAFFDVGSQVDSPVFLDITLTRDTNDTAVDTASHLLSAATLLLIPTKAHNSNELKIDVYAYEKFLKSYRYKEDYVETVGLHNLNEINGNKGAEFISIENLVTKFVNDIEADKLLPKVKIDTSPTRPKSTSDKGA